MKKNKTSLIIRDSILFSVGFFIVFGLVTVLIPNSFFIRMTSINFLDYIFLVLTSILLGIYLSFHRFHKKHGGKVCTGSAVGGGIGGFLGFSCLVCNKILVLLLGVVGVLTYIEPYRPFIGAVSIGLIGYAVIVKGKQVFPSQNR